MVDKEKAINLAPGKDIKDLKRKPEKIPLKELSREQLGYKKQTLLAHLGELEMCIHYAKQDLAAFVLNLDIQNPEKRLETQRAVDDLVKEFELARRELSDINQYL